MYTSPYSLCVFSPQLQPAGVLAKPGANHQPDASKFQRHIAFHLGLLCDWAKTHEAQIFHGKIPGFWSGKLW